MGEDLKKLQLFDKKLREHRVDVLAILQQNGIDNDISLRSIKELKEKNHNAYLNVIQIVYEDEQPANAGGFGGWVQNIGSGLGYALDMMFNGGSVQSQEQQRLAMQREIDYQRQMEKAKRQQIYLVFSVVVLIILAVVFIAIFAKKKK